MTRRPGVGFAVVLRMSYRTAIIAAILAAAGCGTSIRATTINPSPRVLQPRPPETVQIFTSGPPHRPYVDIAYLEAEQSSAYSSDNTPEFLTKLRVQAADMGCDGVVVGGVTHASDEIASITADINASRKGITATCIVYLPDEVAAPPPADAIPPAAAPPPPPAAPPAPTAAMGAAH